MKGITSIARGMAASTSCQRLPALIDISVRPSLQTAKLSPIVCSPYPSRSPWIARQSSTSTSTIGSLNQESIVTQPQSERAAESRVLFTSGRRKLGRNADFKELKDISEGTTLALLRVLGILDTESYSQTGRALQHTQEVIQRRYPDLNSRQVNLQAILVHLLRTSSRIGNRVSPEELIRIHWSLVKDPNSILEKLVKSVPSMEDISKITLQKIPMCQESLQTFKTLLKHTRKHNRTRLFNIIRNYARRFYFGTDSHLLQSSKERMKRQAEMEQVDVMVQSLMLSSSAKRAFHHNLTNRGGLARKGRMRSTSSPQSIFKSHNDIHVMSKILRTRYGALKPKRVQSSQDVDSKIEYRLSRHAADSAHPPLHHSRRTRKVNRLIQRAMSGGQMPRLRPTTSMLAPSTELYEEKGSRDNASQTLLKSVEKTFPSFLKKNKESEAAMRAIDEAMPTLQERAAKMDVIDREVRAWRENVRLWHLRRANVTKNLIRVATESSNDSNVPDPQSQECKPPPLLPTWLFSAALQAHVETGRPRMANHIVQLYLQMLYQNRDVKSEQLVHILPVSPSIVRAITNPLHPPRSEMVLNALLRVQLMSGMTDAWEAMLSVIEKWCSGGEGFADKVRKACGMKSVEESNILDAHRNLRPHQDTGMACLHPNETSILLVLEALGTRHGRKAKAKAVVKEALLRWGPEDMIPDSLQPILESSPRGHNSTFTPTTRTFRALLRIAFGYNKDRAYNNAVLQLFDEWLECINLKALSSGYETSVSQVKSLMFHRVAYEAHREQSRWKKVIKKCLRERQITEEQANEVLAKSSFKF
ncbi:uncharacterized protein FA14DRAFT_176854 [Meira miltonrushii]|uniref:Uncharacterized protein n=1 Tax=Meira miltonrushii TaxID=1280837 RepID=A0A316VMD1_9BASI|nr:uncharacterized protein FA14DRAFT_176854 [Meira miltonrushii]PWN37563.1 hypothetical protein FA14DRAFT_176854 [Meira miltonrushii]